MKRIVASLLTLLLGAAIAQSVPSLHLLGSYVLPNDTVFEGTTVGGISGLSYDATTGLTWLLSDDKSEFDPARVYTAELVFDQDGFDSVELRSVVPLRQPDGNTFPEGSVDPEGLRVQGGRLYVSSEGQNDEEAVVPPMLWEAAFDGSFVAAFDLPDVYLPAAGAQFGVRDNLAFEAVALSPDGQKVFVANENSLLQDGPVSNLTETGIVRITRFDLATGQPTGMFAYVVDPIPVAPEPTEDFADNGMPDLLALSSTQFLALERSYASGVGNANRIYLVDISRATDVSRLASLEGERIAPARKQLVLDLTTLGIRLDNHEAMTFGPDLPDGHRSLIVVSDNNFSDSQITQFLLFEVLPAE